MSRARILSYPLRAAAPRRYLRFVRLIWRLGNVYLRFVRLSEHDTLGITALRLLESCGSRSASTLPSTPRNADSPLFSPLSAPIHLSVRDFQWTIGKGSSQTAPRTVFVLYDDNQLERDIQGRGKFHSARLSCTNIHNPCPKVQKRSVLREHQRPRRAGEVEGLYDTTRGGSTRSPAMRTRPICSAVLPRRTTAARSPSPRCVRRSAMRSSVRSRRPGCRNIRSSSTRWFEDYRDLLRQVHEGHRRSRTACPTRCPRPAPARLRSSPWRHSHC